VGWGIRFGFTLTTALVNVLALLARDKYNFIVRTSLIERVSGRGFGLIRTASKAVI